MNGMVAFLQARLDEDERYLRAMIQAATRAGTALTPAAMSGAYDTALALAEDPQIRRYLAQALDGTLTPPSDLHRLLAGVAAGKARVALYLAAAAEADRTGHGTHITVRDALHAVLRHDAAAHSGHPDYNPAWAPEGRP